MYINIRIKFVLQVTEMRAIGLCLIAWLVFQTVSGRALHRSVSSAEQLSWHS